MPGFDFGIHGYGGIRYKKLYEQCQNDYYNCDTAYTQCQNDLNTCQNELIYWKEVADSFGYQDALLPNTVVEITDANVIGNLSISRVWEIV